MTLLEMIQLHDYLAHQRGSCGLNPYVELKRELEDRIKKELEGVCDVNF